MNFCCLVVVALVNMAAMVNLDDLIDAPTLDDDDWKSEEFRQTVAAKLYA